MPGELIPLTVAAIARVRGANGTFKAHDGWVLWFDNWDVYEVYDDEGRLVDGHNS